MSNSPVELFIERWAERCDSTAVLDAIRADLNVRWPHLDQSILSPEQWNAIAESAVESMLWSAARSLREEFD